MDTQTTTCVAAAAAAGIGLGFFLGSRNKPAVGPTAPPAVTATKRLSILAPPAAPKRVLMQKQASLAGRRGSQVELWDGKTHGQDSTRSRASSDAPPPPPQHKAEDEFRAEHDLLGTLKIPNVRYFGIQTLRAVSN